MNQYNNGYNGAGSSQPPHAASNLSEENYQLRKRLEQIEQRAVLLEKISHFPEQFRAGVIAYPDRKPFTMTLRDELKEDTGNVFGTTSNTSRGAFNVDVDNPTFLTKISFNGYWTASGASPARTLNVDIPFRCEPQRNVASSTSNALSFRWRVRSASDDRIWQASGPNGGGAWRNSADLDENGCYILPLEYELERNDTILIEAQPLAANASGEVCKLFCNLHIYKMYQPLEKLRRF
jgi:hypothetical protein